jgi:hypothetical protein
MRRSEYFYTMLSSSFAETSVFGDRKLYNIVVEEADFVTIYWLLKWVYANWLMFSEDEDPRLAVEGLGAGWSVKWLSTSGASGEWDWKTFNKSHLEESKDDMRSVTSAESIHSGAEAGRSVEQRKPSDNAESLRQRASGSKSLQAQPTPSSSRPSASTVPRRANESASLNAPNSASRNPKPVPISIAPSHYQQASHPHRPGAPASADPHVHPTQAPTPASALSVYQVAHRYGMPGLASLALEHIMSTITPSSSFALLLASSVWEELHVLVEVRNSIYFNLYDLTSLKGLYRG